ncbi:MAG: site-specific DNA-methyltransferase, partial [Sphingomonas sp.]|nr:site-specific DNA-methyltransferase [Sphingomonas sp.]
MNRLPLSSRSQQGPVECLGRTFKTDTARKAFFTDRLREFLEDPQFRNQDGFPTASNEDIINFSDPPFYTACPNPFIPEYIRLFGSEWNHQVEYTRSPMAVDVTVGKSDPVYKAHSYHTKVPHLAIVPSILHYTQPGDLILDGFCGSGMTGIAAQWCGIAPKAYRDEIEKEWKDTGRNAPQWGGRRAIISDLSPAATFIAANYNLSLDIDAFVEIAGRIIDELQDELGWMYQTDVGDAAATIDYTVWSDVYSCVNCTAEIVFHDHALNDDGRVKDSFPCPECSTELTKKSLELKFEHVLDPALSVQRLVPKRVPALIVARSGGRTIKAVPGAKDEARLQRIGSLAHPRRAPVVEFPDMQMTRVGRMRTTGVRYVHDLFTARALHVLSSYLEKAEAIADPSIQKALTIIAHHQFVNASNLNRYRPASSFGNSPLTGVFYVSSLIAEANIFSLLRGSINRLRRVEKVSGWDKHGRDESTIISTNSTTDLAQVADNSIDYIFTDPPFGENIYYSDLNFLVEAWRGVFSETAHEAIIDRVKEKDIPEYQILMAECFAEYYRVLKPGRWMTVVFSNSRASVWNTIQVSLQQAGFVVAEVTTLDKSHLSFQQIVSPNAVKQDLIISAYKPNGGLEDRFAAAGGTSDSAWDFVRTHLKNLAVVKIGVVGQIEIVSERDPRRIYDRMVAWFVRHGSPVPLSSGEFNEELVRRFPERDGMIFLPGQIDQYDKVRMQAGDPPQRDLFVDDERTSIDWITDFLKTKPSTYQELHPEFTQKTGAGWRKHEVKPELLRLLDENFLKFDGDGPVPSQVHAYLSSNWKELRNLDKDDPQLVDKARNRWFVPDPNKQQDVEARRDKALLREFETYKAHKGKKMKEIRLEVMRAGFKAAWSAKDYRTIIDVSAKVPDEVWQEDERLMMLHSMAET